MPVAAVTSVLAAAFLPMFSVETAPRTAKDAAQAWAKAYVDYVTAGGVVGAQAKETSFAAALEIAFDPALGGGGPALLLSAMNLFWLGLVVPAQSAGTVTLFLPISPSVNSPQPADATPQQQANGLAQVIAGLTLGAVKILPVPPGPLLPLL